MELFKTILFVYILGYVLQGFIVVLGVYAFNRQKIIKKSYIITSIIVVVISCLVRLLPLNIGIHTILNMIILFLTCTLLLKMPAFKTMLSALLSTVILLAIEEIYTVVIILVFGIQLFETSMSSTIDKAIMALPSTIIFVIITVLIYFIFTKEKARNNGENHGKISEKDSK